MFSAYFTQAFFPDGWGALGTQPEGAMSGTAGLGVVGIGSIGGLAWVNGSALASMVVSGDLTPQPDQTGHASLSVTAIGTMTFTGMAQFAGTVRYIRAKARPEWAKGSARLAVRASATISADVPMMGTARLGITAKGSASVRSVSVIPTFHESAPAQQFKTVTFHAPIRVDDVPEALFAPVVESVPVIQAIADGHAVVGVEAHGTLTFAVIKEDEPEPIVPEYDDSEDLEALVLMMMEAA